MSNLLSICLEFLSDCVLCDRFRASVAYFDKHWAALPSAIAKVVAGLGKEDAVAAVAVAAEEDREGEM